MKQRILFVCLGNICRSPTAETLMNDVVRKRGLSNQIECDSAGTGAWHAGERPDSRMRSHGNRRGYNIDGRARQFDASDFDAFDYIIAMDDDNYREICRQDRAGQYGDKISKMVDYCSKHQVPVVPDPYYGGAEGFERVLDILEDACAGLLEHLAKSQQS